MPKGMTPVSMQDMLCSVLNLGRRSWSELRASLVVLWHVHAHVQGHQYAQRPVVADVASRMAATLCRAYTASSSGHLWPPITC